MSARLEFSLSSTQMKLAGALDFVRGRMATICSRVTIRYSCLAASAASVGSDAVKRGLCDDSPRARSVGRRPWMAGPMALTAAGTGRESQPARCKQACEDQKVPRRRTSYGLTELREALAQVERCELRKCCDDRLVESKRNERGEYRCTLNKIAQVLELHVYRNDKSQDPNKL